MIKFITAFILVVALANPFCCCSFTPNQQTEKTSEQPENYHCCHQDENPISSQSDEEQPNDRDKCRCSASPSITTNHDVEVQLKASDQTDSYLWLTENETLVALISHLAPASLLPSIDWRPPPTLINSHTLCVFRI